MCFHSSLHLMHWSETILPFIEQFNYCYWRTVYCRYLSLLFYCPGLCSDVNIDSLRVIYCVACCKAAQTFVLHHKMEVQDQESLGRWDGLGSRDATSRTEAMENICQVVMRKVEAIGPILSQAPASGSPHNSDLNDILAHLLMLSKRCPFEDVRVRCARLLQAIQVGKSYRAYWVSFLSCAALSCTRLSYVLPYWCLWYCSAAICSSLHLLISIANLVVESERPDGCFVKWITYSDTMRHHELINTETLQEPRPLEPFSHTHTCTKKTHTLKLVHKQKCRF